MYGQNHLKSVLLLTLYTCKLWAYMQYNFHRDVASFDWFWDEVKSLPPHARLLLRTD